MTTKQKIEKYERLMGMTVHCLIYRRDFVTALSINEEILLEELKKIKLPDIDSFKDIK